MSGQFKREILMVVIKIFFVMTIVLLIGESAQCQILNRNDFYSANYAGRLAVLPSAASEQEARDGAGDATLLNNRSCTRLQWDRLRAPHDVWFMLNHLARDLNSARVFVAVQIAHSAEHG